MAVVWGKNWKREELLSFIGDPKQIAGADLYEYAEGKAQGVRGISVNTGSGFQFIVLPGRGMDIPQAYFKGHSLHFFSGTGITSPAYYEEPGLGWLRSFYVGLLTTCGITYSGAPSVDMGESLGLHGRVANAAAENMCVDQYWDGDDYVISLKGMIREAKAMFENLTITRTVQTRLGMKGFKIIDTIQNNGFEPQPLMMLYHFNFGFPLLGPNAKIVGPVIDTEPRNAEASRDRGVEECFDFPEPITGYNEKVFFHNLKAGSNGKTFMALLNKDIGNKTPLGMILRFNKKELDTFTEWKMPRKGFYVLGLEPGTAVPLGRGKLREMDKLPVIGGQETKTITMEFEVLETVEEMTSVEKEKEKLMKS
jgi:hypothetical protein